MLFICQYIWQTTTTKIKLHSNNNNNNNKNSQHMSFWKLSNLCTQFVVVVIVTVELYCCNNNKMIHETQQEYEQKYSFTYMFCSIIHNSICLLLFCCYSLILLLQQQNYTWEMPIGVLHQVSLTFAVRCTQLRCLMRKVVLCNEYHCVIIHKIDGVRICINWSAEKTVHVTFLYTACKNMWLGGVDTNVQTVTAYSSKCIK